MYDWFGGRGDLGYWRSMLARRFRDGGDRMIRRRFRFRRHLRFWGRRRFAFRSAQRSITAWRKRANLVRQVDIRDDWFGGALRLRRSGPLRPLKSAFLQSIDLILVQTRKLILDIEAHLLAVLQEVFAIDIQLSRQGINTHLLFLLQAELLDDDYPNYAIVRNLRQFRTFSF